MIPLPNLEIQWNLFSWRIRVNISMIKSACGSKKEISSFLIEGFYGGLENTSCCVWKSLSLNASVTFE